MKTTNQNNSTLFRNALTYHNRRFLALQNGPKEVVSAEDAVRAFAVLDNLDYRTLPDFYLGCAAVNLLNTFVKQKPSPIGYSFKTKLYRIIRAAEQLHPNGLSWAHETDGEGRYSSMNVIYAGFDNTVIFSFHQVKEIEPFAQLLCYQQQKNIPVFTFDGIRKQQCAVTVFAAAVEALDMGAGMSLFGEPIQKVMEQYVTLYKMGKCGLGKCGVDFAA